MNEERKVWLMTAILVLAFVGGITAIVWLLLVAYK